MLDGHTFSYDIESKGGMKSYKKSTPIAEDYKHIVIHIVDKSTKELKILAEFKFLLK